MNITLGLQRTAKLAFAFTAISSLVLAGCGGGGSAASTPTTTLTKLMGGSIQGVALNIGAGSGVVSTPAGSGIAGMTDATGTAATFNHPRGITTDGTNLYVAEEVNHAIRKIVISTGVVTRLAGTGVAGAVDGTGTAASFNTPNALTTDGTNLYVADTANNTIRKIVISTGVVSTLAGSGAAGAVDGTGTAASFNVPYDVTTDGTNVYVVDAANNTIRKIVISTGVVSTLAGSGVAGALDGTGTAASFNNPSGITTDGTNLYVSEFGNNKIRKIVIASGVVTTLAGSGAASTVDGTGAAASFNAPMGLTSDGTNLYVSEWGGHKIRKIVIATGVVTSLAGSGVASSADGTGATASFNGPFCITTNGTSLYVAEMLGNKIRKVQ